MKEGLDEIRIPEGLRYRAFLSYRATDRKQAEWLLRKLEAYRVPRALVGTIGELGAIPPRLGRVFRDRDEARSEADIESFIASELAASQHLVVLCTPRAAAPASWVAREIEIFRDRRPAARIHAVIGDGAPPDCFPAPLITTKPDGSVVLPLAADLRPRRKGGQDGRRKALVKIVAGLIGAKFDDLWRREKRRRAFRIAWMTCLAVVIGLGIAASLGVAATMRKVDQYVSLSVQAVDGHRWDLAALTAAAAVHEGAWLGPFQSEQAVNRFRELRNTGRTAAILLGHERAITSVVLDSHARMAFTASLDGRILAWNLERGPAKTMAPRQLHKIVGGARSLLLTGDGTRLVMHGGRRVAIVNLRTGSLIAEARMSDTVRSIALVRGDREIAGGLVDGTLVLLRGDSFEQQQILFQGDAPIKTIATDSAGNRLAFGDGNGSVHAIDFAVAAISPRRITGPGRSAVEHLVFDPSGSFIVASIDDRAAVLDWFTGSTPAWFTEGENEILFSAISPSGRYGLSLMSGDALAVWSVTDGERIAELLVPGCTSSDVFSYACRASTAFFAPQTDTLPERIISGYWDGTIRIWSIRGERLGSLSGHLARVSALALSDDGQSLLSGSEDHSARQWSLSSAEHATTVAEFCRQTDPALLELSPTAMGVGLAFNSEFDKSKVDRVVLSTRLNEMAFRSPCVASRAP